MRDANLSGSLSARCGDRGRCRARCDHGAFSAKERRSRVGRNPRTGQRVPVAAKRVPMFKASKEIREALNQDGVKAPRARKAASLSAGAIEAESRSSE